MHTTDTSYLNERTDRRRASGAQRERKPLSSTKIRSNVNRERFTGFVLALFDIDEAFAMFGLVCKREIVWELASGSSMVQLRGIYIANLNLNQVVTL